MRGGGEVRGTVRSCLREGAAEHLRLLVDTGRLISTPNANCPRKDVNTNRPALFGAGCTLIPEYPNIWDSGDEPGGRGGRGASRRGGGSSGVELGQRRRADGRAGWAGRGVAARQGLLGRRGLRDKSYTAAVPFTSVPASWDVTQHYGHHTRGFSEDQRREFLTSGERARKQAGFLMIEVPL
ncbi:hypothetical protein T484DRAFT_1890269 [Baffinella frigidus]|nr:hypothetical protein T484DRAFT_1890269 [Cryptophyta sp. CCMP2293]